MASLVLHSRSNFVLLEARSNLVRLDARLGLDVGAFFDGDHLVLGGAESHLPDESGGVELCAAWLLEPGHILATVGLHVVNPLLKGLLP